MESTQRAGAQNVRRATDQPPSSDNAEMMALVDAPLAEPLDVSVIVPALNEADNLPALAERVGKALSGANKTFEILIVDDGSRDNTVEVSRQLSQKYPLKLIVRENPRNGLSGAVLHGMALARGDVFVVMDADLQHPPEKLPELLGALEGGADFALGSRYIPGGSTGEKWGVFRQLNSRVATWLARPFAGKVNDPMSGFFALRRSTYNGAERLTPLGYKIALELMCKCRVKQVREVPIHFAERTAGQSKLTIQQQFRYLEHLSRLYDFCYPRLSPMSKFLLATAVAWFVGFAMFLILLRLHVQPAMSTTLAYLGAIVVTAIFHTRYVRTQREFLVRKHPWRDFALASLAEWAACALSAVYATTRLRDPHDLELFFVPFGIALLVRYILRKEFFLDIRGLRRELRKEELVGDR